MEQVFQADFLGGKTAEAMIPTQHDPSMTVGKFVHKQVPQVPRVVPATTSEAGVTAAHGA